MVFSVKMPRVDANIEEGTIGRWLVACGGPVEAGQSLVEIITDKATFELEAEHSGVLRLQVAAEKSVVPVGYVLALIGQNADEPLPDVDAENESLMAAYREALITGERPAVQAPASTPEPGPTGGQGIRATPAARRLAAQHGISLDELARHGPGLIRRHDVERKIEDQGTAP